MGGGVQGWGGVGSGRVVLIDNGRVYQSKAADALVKVKTTKFGTNVGLNMLLNISSRYLGGLFWSRQLRGLPSSDGYFIYEWEGICMNCPSKKTSFYSFDQFWLSKTCFFRTVLTGFYQGRPKLANPGLTAPSHYPNQSWLITSSLVASTWRQFRRKYSRWLSSLWVWN